MLSILFLGCSDETSDRSKERAKLFYMHGTNLNKDGNIVIRYNKNHIEEDGYQCSELLVDKWQKSEVCHNNDFNITIENGIATYVKENKVTKEKLPTMEEIANILDVAFKKSDIKYIPFLDAKNHTWDYRTYLASVGKNRIENCNKGDSICYEKVYYVQIEKKEDIWDIRTIFRADTQGKRSSGELYIYEKIDSRYMRTHILDNYRSLVPISFKQSTALCDMGTGYEYCFIRKEGRILRIQFAKLYTEYLNQISIQMHAYLGGIDDVRSFLFDEKDNLHVFYNDLDKLDGKHFLYEMYTKENPETPINQQKIYWE